MNTPSAAALLTLAPRCAAAHSEERSPCEGPRAVVRIVDQNGNETTGCVHHAAVLYASLACCRVYPSPGHAGDVTEVYRRAQMLDSRPWRAVTAA
ncbi:hypothetical protein [Streptomyces albidus (ex Kaewkla and Franco 2022)]|uniref:hypothetical protein n=1 Tax=Streptomyces albidus (ex Kaewkla and Franco 2022) TaxID=722709 RepID=UPI001F2933CF|nr:hypothetical protein [Streptomyces albidus (ex Kaewkla and Franco 2022)]